MNAKGDDFLLNVIGPNIPALEAVKHIVYTASRSSNYRTHHSVIDWYADVAQVALALAHENVFTFKAGRGSTGQKSDGIVVNLAPDLLVQGSIRLGSGVPLREYLAKARANWLGGG